MAKLSFFSTDVGVVVPFAVTAPGGAVFPLDGYTIKLLVKGLTASPLAVSLDDPAQGLCSHTVAEDEFPVGKYKAQLALEKASSVLHTDLFSITVLAGL